MSREVTVTNVRVINECQCGVCGVGSSDCDSWVTNPAWEQDAIAAANAAEQHYQVGASMAIHHAEFPMHFV